MSLLLTLTSSSPVLPPTMVDPPSEVRAPQGHPATLSETVYQELKAIGQYVVDHPRTVLRDGALVVAVLCTAGSGIAAAAGAAATAAAIGSIAASATAVRAMVEPEAPCPTRSRSSA